MNLQAEKLEVVKMIIDTDDKSIINEVKSLFKSRAKVKSEEAGLEKFYDGFRDSVREVKSSMNGDVVLKDAKTWLDELPD